MVGSTMWVIASKGAALDLITQAVLRFGPALASTAGLLSGSAIGLVIVCGAIKGGFAALNNQPKTEAIAAVIDDRPVGKIRVVAPAAPAAVTPTAPAVVAPQVLSTRAQAPARSTTKVAAPVKAKPTVAVPARAIRTGGDQPT